MKITTTRMMMTITFNLAQSIIGWEGKDIVANSSEIVYEGKLKVRLPIPYSR